MAHFKKTLALLLVFAFVIGAGFADAAFAVGAKLYGAPAALAVPADSDYDGIPDAYDSAPNSNTFTGKMKSGQFDEADISIKQLNAVKDVLKAYLSRIYHERIAYPQRKNNANS